MELLKPFDGGKVLLFASICFLFVLSARADDDHHKKWYECSYLEPIGGHHGWYSIEKIHCQYGCCGDLYKQRCCTKAEHDKKAWIIGLSIVGGLLVISIIVIIVLCVMKKKNLERAKIYTSTPPAPLKNQGVVDFCVIGQRAPSAPPPYSSQKSEVFTVDKTLQQGHGQVHDTFVVETSKPPAYTPIEKDNV